ncbi:MAG: EutP/PduV family microcompartment system protein [Clostridiales bacterium]|jgi:ethanolamine utilization protein EutP|nr:EutP/PduV family microcompartment system protein [Clostridiales bacterium]
MKKMMLIGTRASGKASFAQTIKSEELAYKQTQNLLLDEKLIVTPNDYFDKDFFINYTPTQSDGVEVVALLQAANDPDTMFQPLLATMFSAEVIGIITKIDLLEKDSKRAEQILEFAGCSKIFHTSSIEKQGFREIIDYLSTEH